MTSRKRQKEITYKGVKYGNKHRIAALTGLTWESVEKNGRGEWASGTIMVGNARFYPIDATVGRLVRLLDDNEEALLEGI